MKIYKPILMRANQGLMEEKYKSSTESTPVIAENLERFPCDPTPILL
jgi:hypothetical protein